jgi:mannose-1-phosphate guanylyltransferase/mannose-6-phosphate isomerase
MDVIILSGGQGARLWPLSRVNYPKQFLKIENNNTLLYNTLKRILSISDIDNVVVSTNKSIDFLVRENLKELNDNILIISEPSPKNTLPAIAYSIRYLVDMKKTSILTPILIAPSDHIIKEPDQYIETILYAAKLAEKGFIVTVGIEPDRIEHGYGYIKKGIDIHKNAYKVDRFVEKPAVNLIKEFINSGDYLWNTGMFLMTPQTFEQELILYERKIYEIYTKGFDNISKNFSSLPDISIDYSIMEKTDKAVVVKGNFKWTDVGSFDHIYDISNKDERNNVIVGKAILNNTENSLIISNERLISLVDVKDSIVVDTDDALLISRRNTSQDIKQMVNYLKKEIPDIVDHSKMTYKPWGYYKILDEGLHFKVKEIAVREGEQLSLQMHNRRDEHWSIVEGEAEVTLDNKTLTLEKNERLFVPKLTKHRVKNKGNKILIFIEVQIGDYLGEDDIVRFDDIYGRI